MSENRSELVGGLWFFSMIVLVALFISAGMQGELTTGHIFLTFAILAPAVAGTVFFFWKENAIERAKAKREGIDNLVRNLSAEERLELKLRLSAADPPETPVGEHVGDDGELVWREKS